MITFTDLFDVARNAVLRSEQKTMFETGTLGIEAVTPSTASADVAIVKNGFAVGDSSEITTLDVVSLQVKSSSEFADAVHVAYSFNGERGVWSVITGADQATYANPARSSKSVYDQKTDDDGISVIYLPTKNAMHVMPGVSGGILTTTSLSVGDVESSALLSAERLVCSFYDRRLLLLSADGREVLRTVSLPGKPHSLTQFGSLILVALTDTDTVVAIDAQGQIRHSVLVGKAPAGVFTSSSSGSAVVCNSGDDTVSRLSLVDGVLSVTATIGVGKTPLYGIAAVGEDWVSCSGESAIYRIEGSTAFPLEVGSAPKQMYAAGQNLFVACLGEDKIYVVDGTQTIGVLDTDRCPYSITGAGPNRIAVTCIGSRSVVEIDTNTGAQTARHTFDGWPMFVKMFGTSELRVLELWDMTPSYLHALDTNPHPFVLDKSEPVIPGALVETNQFTVVGVNTPTKASVAPVSDTRILKNGVDAGVSTYVISGDKVSLSIRAPEEHTVAFQARLSIGSQLCDWTCRTREIDDVVHAFSLDTVTDAELSTEYTSNVVTLDGLEEGTEVLADCAGGRLFVNGAEVLTAIPVSNGDQLYVKLTSAPVYSTMSSAMVTVGGFQEAWTVVSKASLSPSFFQPVSDAGKTVADLFKFSSWTDAQVDTGKNRVLRFDKASLGKKAEYDLTATPTGNGLSEAPRLYAVDAHTRSLLVVDYDDPSAPGVERIYVESGIPYCVAAGPLVSLQHQPTSHYYSVLGSNRIRRIGSTQHIDMQASSRPMGIAVSNFNKMYVADDNGLIHVYNYNESQDRFYLETIFAVPGGGRLQDIIIDESTLYITDITNSCVHIVKDLLYRGNVKVGLLPYSITQSGTQVFTADFGTATISYFHKDNPSAPRSILQLPEGASQPLGMAYDAETGNLYVACSRSSSVYVIRVQDMTVQRRMDVGPVWGVQVIKSDLFAVTLWGNILEEREIGLKRANPTSLAFAPIEDADLDTTYAREAKLIEDFVIPEPAYVEPYTDAVLTRNGFVVEPGTTFKKNDVLGISIPSRNEYDVTRTVGVMCGQRYTELVVRTVRDEFPDVIVFPSVQGVIPKDRVESETRTVSGIEEGLVIKCRAQYSEADFSAGIEVLLNGVPVEDTSEFYVTNGDTLKISYTTTNLKWNGASVSVQILNERGFAFASFTAYSGYLDYAIWYPRDTDMMEGMSGIEYAPNNAWIVEADSALVKHKADVGFKEDRDAIVACKPDVQTEEERLLIVSTAATYGQSSVQEAQVDQRSFTETSDGVTWVPSSIRHPVEVAEQFTVIALINSFFSEAAEISFVQKLPRESLNYRFVGAEIQSYRPQAIHEIQADVWETRGRSQVGVLGSLYDKLERQVLPLYNTEQHWLERVRSSTRVFWTLWAQRLRPESTAYAASYVDNTDRSQKLVREKEYVKHGRDSVRFSALYVSRDRIHSPWFSAMYEDRKASIKPETGADYRKVTPDRPKWFLQSLYTAAAPLTQYQARGPVWVKSLRNTGAIGSQYVGSIRMLNSTVPMEIERELRSRSVEASASGYESVKVVLFDAYEYEAGDIRAFVTEEDAIAAGTEALHPVVFSKKLWDSNWMWHIPALIERVDCGNTAMMQRYLRGHIQGG